MKPQCPMTVFAQRRQQLLNQIGDALLILPSAQLQIRNRDCHYPFRQDSDFWYLSHFNEPNAILLLDGKTQQSILFSAPFDELYAIWEGEIIGQQRAVDEYLFDEAHCIDKFDEKIVDYLFSRDTIISPFSRYPDFDKRLLAPIQTVKNTRRARAPQNHLHSDQFIHPMRLIKDQYELAIMQYAADISVQAHEAAMAATRPGMNEAEVAALFDYHFNRVGGTAAYGHIVAGGHHACVLHYKENNDTLKDGDLLLIDAGCEIDGYAADITRTFPVSGQFSEIQKKAYHWVLKSMEVAIEACLPGNHIRSPHYAAEKVLIEAMLDLGLVQGTVDSVLADKSYHRYFMHGTSHWLGIDVHDVGDYRDEKGNWLTLQPGMVVTVEPGLYIRQDDQQAPKALRGLGIRIEDDILITQTGNQNLTDKAAKTIQAIESACRRTD